MKYAFIEQIARIKHGLILGLLLFCSTGHPSFGADQNISALRSAYLYYFTNLIDWPSDAHFIENTINLCALTTNEDDKFQLSTINNKQVNSKYLRITFLDNESPLNVEQCNIVFISPDHSLLNDTIKKLNANHVLLVTEGNTKTQGAIKLFTDGKKLKFQIDSNFLSNHGFKVSSKLLRLSKREGE